MNKRREEYEILADDDYIEPRFGSQFNRTEKVLYYHRVAVSGGRERRRSRTHHANEFTKRRIYSVAVLP